MIAPEPDRLLAAFTGKQGGELVEVSLLMIGGHIEFEVVSLSSRVTVCRRVRLDSDAEKTARFVSLLT